jgi:hypothetical protein
MFMETNEERVSDFVRDPLAYAEETLRLAEELQGPRLPSVEVARLYKRRRVIEERLRNLRMLQRFEESQDEDG